jgi:RimJ/RimL family protein N-acetyltransferase
MALTEQDNPAMSAPFSIRALVASDLPAYKQLRDECLHDFPEAFTSDYATERHRTPESYTSRLGTPNSGHCLWGAFDVAGQLQGSIAMEKDRDPRPQRAHLATVTAVMVRQSAQRQGIAPLLIAACADAAKANPQLDQLILTVTASNTHVVRLYERAGFVAYGLLPRAICVQGQYFDKLHMRLDLAALRASSA